MAMNAVLTINRFNEAGQVPARSERFYQNKSEWYYSVRTDLDKGPFKSFDDARHNLTNYIKASLSA